MDTEQCNDIVVLRPFQDEYGTDYLFLTVDDLLSIGHPAHRSGIVRGQVTFAKEEYIKNMLAPGIHPIKSVFGERWNNDGLLLPTTDDLEKLPEMRFDNDTEVFWVKKLREFEHWNGFMRYVRNDFWLNCLNSDHVADEMSIIFVDHEAVNFIPGKAGWLEFRNMIAKADQDDCDYKKIGSGSEGIVYEVMWEGKPCALKLFNREAQAKFDKIWKEQAWGVLTPHHSRPNFLGRIGFMKKLMRVINSIPELPFHISGCSEYAISHNFIFMPLIPGVALSNLLSEEDKPITADAEEFICQIGINEAELRQVVEGIEYMGKVVSMTRYAGAFPDHFHWHDFFANNFIVQGKDQSTGKLCLTLIDQGQYRQLGGDMLRLLEWQEHQSLYDSAFETYTMLAKNEAYREFLLTYFPDGWPAFNDKWLEPNSETC
jgi:hypothetical protein